MDKFLIFGASSRLAKHFIAKYGEMTIPIHHKDIDSLSKFDFTYLINCAALTDIEYCESHPDETFEVNYELPKKLKKYRIDNDKKLILFSSNYAIDPINVYGKSKKKMEELADKNTLVIRTDFYDKDNFIIKNLINKKSISAYKNSYFSPVSVNRLVEEIFKNKDKNGLLNIFSNQCLSFYDFSIKVEKILGLNNLVSESLQNSKIRPLNGCVKSDVEINLENDLQNYIKNLL